MSLVELKPAHQVFTDDRYEIVYERERAEALVRGYRGDAVAMHTLREMLATGDQNVFHRDDGVVLALIATKIVKGELRVRKDPCERKNEKNRRYLDWILRHKADTVDIAAGLRTTLQNVLGLAAFESDFGRNRNTLIGNNYFSLMTTKDEPLPGQIGLLMSQADQNLGVAKFQDYLSCAKAFAQTIGQFIVGEPDPARFASIIQTRGKFGINVRGPLPTYVEELTNVIHEVAIRLNCS